MPENLIKHRDDNCHNNADYSIFIISKKTPKLDLINIDGLNKHLEQFNGLSANEISQIISGRKNPTHYVSVLFRKDPDENSYFHSSNRIFIVENEFLKSLITAGGPILLDSATTKIKKCLSSVLKDFVFLKLNPKSKNYRVVMDFLYPNNTTTTNNNNNNNNNKNTNNKKRKNENIENQTKKVQKIDSNSIHDTINNNNNNNINLTITTIHQCDAECVGEYQMESTIDPTDSSYSSKNQLEHYFESNNNHDPPYQNTDSLVLGEDRRGFDGDKLKNIISWDALTSPDFYSLIAN